jgi:hypothetical protein
MWAAHGQHEVKSSLHRPLELRKVKIAVKLEKFQGVADKGTRGGAQWEVCRSGHGWHHL